MFFPVQLASAALLVNHCKWKRTAIGGVGKGIVQMLLLGSIKSLNKMCWPQFTIYVILTLGLANPTCLSVGMLASSQNN